MVVRVGKALLEDRTFIWLGLKRGNLCQIPSIALMWDGGPCALTQIVSLTTTLSGGERRRQTGNVAGGKENGGRYTGAD